MGFTLGYRFKELNLMNNEKRNKFSVSLQIILDIAQKVLRTQ